MSSVSRILVAEDHAILLLDLVDQLGEHGYAVVPATTARSAAALLDRSIDAIVTDIEMPGDLTGLDLARYAARLRPDMPIVVVSGGVRPKPEDLPPNAVFLPKPYRLDDILAAMHRPARAHAA
ncbi:response regulator [Devosia sp. PTR5]|uniref:Response regulator n=1 Tax=Devosia oryzisoli TaxID=2774138 RepID=A0A927IRQ1_9HYPH|nr:response regulator [Devosia oryzisoli]MBD8064022.1 response regulator [Devosia oryzisoli]